MDSSDICIREGERKFVKSVESLLKGTVQPVII